MNNSTTTTDLHFMLRALELAAQAKGHTFPNPAVGAVLVKAGRIVGEGRTARYGGDHAEKAALAEAGAAARGSTLYVTLEPCCHHGRTPPCTDAIIAAGVVRVVAAMKDPNPLVAGKGFATLRRKKISVENGLCGEDAYALNEDFCWAITHKTPWVSLKLALTLDGRIADDFGDSKWITTEKSRMLVHQLRSRHAAIAVGSGTLLKDDPALTVRHVKGPSPVRCVFSSSTSIPDTLQFSRTARSVRSILICPGKRLGDKEVLASGVEVWRCGTRNRTAMAEAFLRMAHDEGLNSVLIEGGGKLASLFLEAGLVNRLYLFYGNKIVGKGVSGFSFSAGVPMKNAVTLSRVEHHRLRDDWMVTGLINKKT